MQPIITEHEQNRPPLAVLYRRARAFTEQLTETLQPEDMTAQAMPDASPAKWHLAHTSWFFEQFLLQAYLTHYQPHHSVYSALFNSYYQSIGPQFSRANRHVLTRPTVKEIMEYRLWVDQHMPPILELALHDDAIAALLELGIHHEQQHQELLLTDIKCLFFMNPLYPAYRPSLCADSMASPMRWIGFEGGVHDIGHAGRTFAFDNELPRHKTYLAPFRLASRPVTNGEYLSFMEAGGYSQSHYWLAEGWDKAKCDNWNAPLYWVKRGGEWHEYTLSGLRPLQLNEPVCHVSYYEANAYAHWKGARLPTEAEWEVAAKSIAPEGPFLDIHRLHPKPATTQDGLQQLFGEVWQWTSSAYSPYPGYKALTGAVGEYNGKFMCGQMVLRGGSCVTPPGHIRASYRNYFHPAARWQFSGIRLAGDKDSSCS